MIKKLPILLEGDPLLRVVCQPIEKVTAELQDLALSMTHTMVHSNGIGLSAPQIGKSIQLLVVDTTYTERGGTAAIMFNPELLHGEGKVTSKEGCLSFSKNYFVEVERFVKVKMKYLNIQNKPIIREFTGLAAIALQHELDHLNGIILSDYEKD